MSEGDKRLTLGVFEKYIAVWIIACMAVGFLLGKYFPWLGPLLNSVRIYDVSVPMAVCMFFLMYPALAGVRIEEIRKAVKSPKPTILTLTANWLIAPSLTTLLSYIVLNRYPEYMAGVILLGIAPCTGMVLFWTALAGGNVAQGIVVTAINAVSTVFLYAPLATLYLGVTGIPVPISLIALSVFLFLGLPLAIGQLSRQLITRRRGALWFEEKFLPFMHNLSAVALLTILIIIFQQEAETIIADPFAVLLIAIPITAQFILVISITLAIAWLLRFSYKDAAMAAFVGSGTQFEIAIATATVLFGLGSGAAFATVVGPLLEVPLMITFTKMVLRLRNRFSKF